MAFAVIVMQFEFNGPSSVRAIMYLAGYINLPAALFQMANGHFHRFALIEKEENPGTEYYSANQNQPAGAATAPAAIRIGSLAACHLSKTWAASARAR
jgi:hypothetical protein